MVNCIFGSKQHAHSIHLGFLFVPILQWTKKLKLLSMSLVLLTLEQVSMCQCVQITILARAVWRTKDATLTCWCHLQVVIGLISVSVAADRGSDFACYKAQRILVSKLEMQGNRFQYLRLYIWHVTVCHGKAILQNCMLHSGSVDAFPVLLSVLALASP